MDKAKQYDIDQGLEIIKGLDTSLGKVDTSNPTNLSNKVLNERETRKRILTHSRYNGCEREMMILFAKFDKLMKNCTNERERQDMSKLACVEMFKLLGGVGELYVNGDMVFTDK